MAQAKRIFVIVLLVVLSSAAGMTQTDKVGPSDIWRKMIDAKGGESRLSSVKVLVIRSDGDSTSVNVFGFPARWWRYADQGTFGQSVYMYDFEREFGFEAISSVGIERFEPMERQNGFFKEHPIILDGSVYNAEKEIFLVEQSMFLLKSGGFEPTLVSARVEHENSSDVLVLRVKIGRVILDYHLDKTYLPCRIDGFIELDGKSVPSPSYSVFFGEYRDFDGVKMPTRSGRSNRLGNRLSYSLNSQINPDLFSSPPAIHRGPDAWRPIQVEQKR